MNLFGENVLHKIRCFRLGSRSHYCEKVNTITKRGSMLSQMIKNTDKRKNWHFEILQNNAKSRNVFEKVSRPSRRQNVLNALFIRNITDVLSTGDMIPEIIGSGIEITGVKIAPCCKILNVYWQIPKSSYESEDILATALNQKAHKIRAEIISRNLMGRVPQIFFIRDVTNAYLAAFEKAIQEVEADLKGGSAVVPDDSFLKKKKLFKFVDSKPEKKKEPNEIFNETVKETSEKPATAPPKPMDMRSDVFGLNHELMMNKVNALKAKPKLTEKTNVITAPEWAENETIEDDDLFSKIPGTTVHSDSNREELLKQFHIERKKLMQNKRKMPKNDDGFLLCEENEVYEEPELSKFSFDDDYVEEDTPERF